MSHLEVISFLLEHASEESVLDYVAKKIKTSENYFASFSKEKLLTDFLISA